MLIFTDIKQIYLTPVNVSQPTNQMLSAHITETWALLSRRIPMSSQILTQFCYYVSTAGLDSTGNNKICTPGISNSLQPIAASRTKFCGPLVDIKIQCQCGTNCTYHAYPGIFFYIRYALPQLGVMTAYGDVCFQVLTYLQTQILLPTLNSFRLNMSTYLGAHVLYMNTWRKVDLTTQIQI